VSDLPEDSEPEEIIEDLESIKDLLAEQRSATNLDSTDAAATPADSMSQNDDVPLLDDPVEETVKIDEGLPDDTFKTLLGDAWQDSVDDLFINARASITRNSTTWLPEHTEELAQALKIRIDTSVKSWLAETLEANIGLLRERIVAELSDELLEQMREKFTVSEHKKDNDLDHG